MFRKKQRKAIEVTKLSSLVSDNMAIMGDVMFSGGLRVDGRIDGNVVSEEGTNGLLVLSEKGVIKGRVKTYDAVINGSISGDLEVEHFLELQANARVTGNIIYRQLQLDCGATVDGQLVCVTDAPEAAPTGVKIQKPAGSSPTSVASSTSVATPVDSAVFGLSQ